MSSDSELTAAEAVEAAFAVFGRERAALIPILQHVQAALGYLPEEAITRIADGLRISSSEVFGVVSFYAQFRLTPTGKHLVRVCRGTACHVRGGASVRRAVEQYLEVGEGETTPDLAFTYETVACVGACALAPVMVANEVTYGEMSAEKAREILDTLSARNDHL